MKYVKRREEQEQGGGDVICFICFFVLFIAVEIDSKLTFHHMGKVLLFNLLSLKSGGLLFLKVFKH